MLNNTYKFLHKYFMRRLYSTISEPKTFVLTGFLMGFDHSCWVCEHAFSFRNSFVSGPIQLYQRYFLSNLKLISLYYPSNHLMPHQQLKMLKCTPLTLAQFCKTQIQRTLHLRKEHWLLLSHVLTMQNGVPLAGLSEHPDQHLYYRKN